MEIQSVSACTSIESSPRIPPEQNEDHAIDESRTLFLGDLPSSATVEQISALFLDLQVSHVEIKIINSTKGTLCYSFVSFANADFCQRAFDKYDGNQAIFPDGSIVRVGWAKRNSRLHVSNLDENTTEKDLVDLFTKYGELSQQDGILVIKKPSSNPQIQHQTVCYGVVNFDQRESAEVAKNALHNTYFGGRRLRVEWNRASRKSLVTRFPSEENVPSDPLLHYAPQSPVISIYVQFETLDTESTANEALIAEVFEPFGHMTGCFIKTNNTSVSGLRQHGYAFVHFDNSYEGKKSALAAASISKECPYQHHGVLFHAEISKNFKKATSHSQSAYGNYKTPYSTSHSRDEEDYASPSDEHYGDSYKTLKPEYANHGHGTSSPGATYYYPQSTAQYMMPYHNHNNHHSNHHNGSHNSHHSQSVIYQSVQYQTPYNSSYSPAGSNSDFPESNPALYYVKQPYGNYSQHSHHGGINHMGSYTASNSSQHSHASNNNPQERSYQNSPSDPSLVPTALQPMMSYTGPNSTGSSGPSTPTSPSEGGNMPSRYYTGGGWQQQQLQQQM